MPSRARARAGRKSPKKAPAWTTSPLIPPSSASVSRSHTLPRRIVLGTTPRAAAGTQYTPCSLRAIIASSAARGSGGSLRTGGGGASCSRASSAERGGGGWGGGGRGGGLASALGGG